MKKKTICHNILRFFWFVLWIWGIFFWFFFRFFGICFKAPKVTIKPNLDYYCTPKWPKIKRTAVCFLPAPSCDSSYPGWWVTPSPGVWEWRLLILQPSRSLGWRPSTGRPRAAQCPLPGRRRRRGIRNSSWDPTRHSEVNHPHPKSGIVMVIMLIVRNVLVQ